jgi:DNA-binding IclR family transcriptional regulator
LRPDFTPVSDWRPQGLVGSRSAGYVDRVPGSIQSVERAAAILRMLGRGPGPLRLAEISSSLQLAKGTAHGLLRTLTEVGFVEQDRVSGRYRLGGGLATLGHGYLDGNELRARSMNWADPLAARTGAAVRIGMLDGDDVLVVHYVFRPDQAPQHADVGARLPAHATALGKLLLAHHPGALTLLLAHPPLTSFTARTLTQEAELEAELAAVRGQGYAVEYGEQHTDLAGIAAPVMGFGGETVGAVEIHGDLDRICDAAGRPRRALLAQVRECGRAISRELKTSRTGE